MKRPWILWVLGGVAVLVVLAVLGADEVVVDKLFTLNDGQYMSFKLDEGTYKVEMTASGDGAAVKWVGCSCPGSTGEQSTCSTICELKSQGQLIVENPTVFGEGAGSSVTLKVTKTSS